MVVLEWGHDTYVLVARVIRLNAHLGAVAQTETRFPTAFEYEYRDAEYEYRRAGQDMMAASTRYLDQNK